MVAVTVALLLPVRVELSLFEVVPVNDRDMLCTSLALDDKLNDALRLCDNEPLFVAVPLLIALCDVLVVTLPLKERECDRLRCSERDAEPDSVALELRLTVVLVVPERVSVSSAVSLPLAVPETVALGVRLASAVPVLVSPLLLEESEGDALALGERVTVTLRLSDGVLLIDRVLVAVDDSDNERLCELLSDIVCVVGAVGEPVTVCEGLGELL